MLEVPVKDRPECWTSLSTQQSVGQLTALSLSLGTLTLGPKVISEQKFPMHLHKLNMNMQHSTLGDRTSEKISNLSDVILLISGKAGIHM